MRPSGPSSASVRYGEGHRVEAGLTLFFFFFLATHIRRSQFAQVRRPTKPAMPPASAPATEGGGVVPGSPAGPSPPAPAPAPSGRPGVARTPSVLGAPADQALKEEPGDDGRAGSYGGRRPSHSSAVRALRTLFPPILFNNWRGACAVVVGGTL